MSVVMATLVIWRTFCIFNIFYDLRFAKLIFETFKSVFVDATLNITFVRLNFVYRSWDSCKLNGHVISLHVLCTYFQINLTYDIGLWCILFLNKFYRVSTTFVNDFENLSFSSWCLHNHVDDKLKKILMSIW